MATSVVDAMFAQANFMEVVGAILPNARIDFQLTGPELPQLNRSQDKAGQGCCEPDPSDCSTARTLESPMGARPQLEPEGEPDSPPDSYEDSGRGDETTIVFGTFGTRTPESGTPEWSPRRTHEENKQVPMLDYEIDTQAPLDGQSTATGTPEDHFFGAEPPPPLPDHVTQDGLCQPDFACGQPQIHSAVPENILAAHHLSQPWVGSEMSPPEHMPQLQQSQAQAPTAVWCDAAPEPHSWYRVAFLGGIELRMQPSYLAARTGVLLPQNEVFAVSAEIVGADGRIYLRLADGRGWAFDDSALLPHDPSVVRGHFTENPSAVQAPATTACAYSEQMPGAAGNLPMQAHAPEFPAPHLLSMPVYPNTILQHEPALSLPPHLAALAPLPAHPLAFGSSALPSQFPYAHPDPYARAPPQPIHFPGNAPTSALLTSPAPLPGTWSSSQPSFSSHAASFDPTSAVPHQVAGSLRNPDLQMPQQVAGSLRNFDQPGAFARTHDAAQIVPHQVVGSLRNPGAAPVRQVDSSPLQAQLSQQWAPKPLQAELSQQWGQMEQAVSETPLVTSDCPPMWEPSVPPQTQNLSRQNGFPQYS